jgi:hypothetical protein
MCQGGEGALQALWAGSIPAVSTQRKVAGYGLPDRFAKAALRLEIRVRIPCLPLWPRW